MRGLFPAPHHHDPNETLPNFQIWVMVGFFLNRRVWQKKMPRLFRVIDADEVERWRFEDQQANGVRTIDLELVHVEVSCCGSHYPLPRRCGDVTFSRFVTPLRVWDSYVWFEGALPLTVQLVWGARSCVIKGRGIWEFKTVSARARSFCFKSERTSVPSGTPRSERERAKTEKVFGHKDVQTEGVKNRRVNIKL